MIAVASSNAQTPKTYPYTASPDISFEQPGDRPMLMPTEISIALFTARGFKGASDPVTVP